jgi:hypothetical protein
LRYCINDMTETAEIVGAAEHRTEILPAVANRVAGVRVPARVPRAVAFAIAMIGIPEQIAVFMNAEDDAAASKEMTKILPPVTDCMTGVRASARVARPIAFAIAMVGIPKQIAILRDSINRQAARTRRALLRRDKDVTESLPAITDWVA